MSATVDLDPFEQMMMRAWRGEGNPVSDEEVIRAFEDVIGRRATNAEIGRVFAIIETASRAVVREALGDEQATAEAS